jgi:DNA-binding XRE family transcriptional regulator
MPEPSDPEVLRREILGLLGKVTNRGSLLFFRWLIRNIGNKELPPIPELKKLHQSFIRITDAIENKRDVTSEDWRMMFRYVGEIGDNLDIFWHLASTVKFYREKAGLTKAQVAKRARINVKTMLALERGGIKDMSLSRLYQLAGALNQMRESL